MIRGQPRSGSVNLLDYCHFLFRDTQRRQSHGPHLFILDDVVRARLPGTPEQFSLVPSQPSSDKTTVQIDPPPYITARGRIDCGVRTVSARWYCRARAADRFGLIFSRHHSICGVSKFTCCPGSIQIVDLNVVLLQQIQDHECVGGTGPCMVHPQSVYHIFVSFNHDEVMDCSSLRIWLLCFHFQSCYRFISKWFGTYRIQTFEFPL